MKDKQQRIRDFGRTVLEEDVADLRVIKVKDAAFNVALGLLQLLVVAFHLVLGLWQLVASLLIVGYDGVVWVLKKLMPGAKTEKEAD